MKKSMAARVLIAGAGVACILALGGCPSRTARAPARAEAEAVSSASAEAGPGIDSWEKAYPAELSAWKRSSEMEESPSGFGGSVPVEKSIAQPEMLTNFKGSAFAVSFKEKRGHLYSWEDITTTKRVTAKTPGSCITCKTPAIMEVFQRDGWGFARRPVADLFDPALPAINCFSCHDPATKIPRISVPSFSETLVRLGVDVSKAGRKEMGSYVCAQCHSTYYLEPETNRVVSPWDKGLDPEQMFAYYQGKPAGFEKDYVQPDSGVGILKARHPDYELFSGGIHAAAGITCVDCHMPFVMAEGKRVRDHRIRSPLHDVGAACLGCHRGKTEAWLKARVAYDQDSVAQAERLAGTRVAEAHGAISAAAARGRVPASLGKARGELREGQWYWDYVASANSMGFHNPILAHRTLAKALDLAARAIQDAEGSAR